jgi:hypothetical protein
MSQHLDNKIGIEAYPWGFANLKPIQRTPCLHKIILSLLLIKPQVICAPNGLQKQQHFLIDEC